jgi:hypothetical protein
MNKSAGITRIYGWHIRGPWMMRKRKKKSIRQGGASIIRGPRKIGVSKPRERGNDSQVRGRLLGIHV